MDLGEDAVDQEEFSLCIAENKKLNCICSFSSLSDCPDLKITEDVLDMHPEVAWVEGSFGKLRTRSHGCMIYLKNSMSAMKTSLKRCGIMFL